MSANGKRLCVHYLTYLGSGEKTGFLLSVHFFRVVVGLAVDIFGHVRSFADRKKQPVIQPYIFAPVKKNGVLTRINISVMEIVTIEKKTFELWKQRFENFVGRVDALCVPLRRKRDKWLDNCETCRLLNVSARRCRLTVIRGNCLIRRLTIRFTTRLRTWKPFCSTK